MIRIILASTLALSAICGAAHAQTAAADSWKFGPVSRTVSFSDLDLGTHDGARRMAFRIQHAAQVLCGGDNLSVRTGTGFNACVSTTVEQAATRLNAPLVTEALSISPGRPVLAGR